MRNFLISALLLVLLSGTAKAGEPIYLGASKDDGLQDVSILFVNYNSADNGTLKCRVVWIIPPRGQRLKTELDYQSVVVVKPRRYGLTGMYAGLRDGVTHDEYTFKPGKKYKVDCTGLSFRAMKISVEEV